MQTDGTILVESLRRIAQRDARALETLYDRFSPLLYRTILSIVRRREDAEEVLGAVFFHVWQKAADYSPAKGSVYGWLLCITRSRALDRLRTRGYKGNQRENSGGIDPDEMAQVGGADPLEQAHQSQCMERVRAALECIPPEQRKVIEEAYLRGYSQSEVAGRLGMPLGTVKTRMRDGMKTLQILLKDAA